MPIGYPSRKDIEIELRDQFAMAALIGLISYNDNISKADDECETAASPEDFSKIAYQYADAMLKAREVK